MHGETLAAGQTKSRQALVLSTQDVGLLLLCKAKQQINVIIMSEAPDKASVPWVPG